MKNLLERLKKMISKNKIGVNNGVMFFILLTFILLGVFTINNRDELLPQNPLNVSADNNSQVPLSGDYKDLLIEDEGKETEEEDQNENETEEQDDEIDESENEEDSNKSNIEQQNLSRINNETTSGDQLGSGIDGSGNGGEANLDVEITDPKGDLGKTNEYFTTSIKNGETVTSKNYSFNIRQLDHSYKVRDIQVKLSPRPGKVNYISDEWETVTNVNSTLTQGENKIIIRILYEDDEGNIIPVSARYTVKYTEEEIIFDTNLETRDVYEENFKFFARALRGDATLPIVVTLNGESVTGKNSNYEIKLHEGKNIIALAAEDSNLQAEETYTINYQKIDLYIDTTLKDDNNKTVSTENFSFAAKGINRNTNERTDLTIYHNDQLIEENEEGSYSVALVEGNNDFELTTSYKDQTYTEEYRVLYEPDAVGPDNPDQNEYAPTIEILDLNDGDIIRNSVQTFHVKAYTYDGKSILAGNGSITATNNGVGVPINWLDSQQISFTLSLSSGKNYIEVTARDKKGNTATKSLTVNGELSEEGEPIGTATFSLEATTIGLGYLIPAHEVEIYQGELSSELLVRVLEEYGFTYHNTGSLENSFYLSTIYKDGLLSNPTPVIPEDLAELVERDSARFDPDDYEIGVLGEFDFSSGSGWMYSVNGSYPNVGFSDYYLKDGDTIRVRFTLALGADIGGAMAGSDYDKEW